MKSVDFITSMTRVFSTITAEDLIDLSEPEAAERHIVNALRRTHPRAGRRVAVYHVLCSVCGTAIYPHNNYCPHCGQMINWIDTPKEPEGSG